MEQGEGPGLDWTLRAGTAAEWPAIADLLARAGLPLAGAEAHLDAFTLAVRGDALVGCAALERYGEVALLRSVATAEGERGRGIGDALVREVLHRARGEGVRTVVLLTTTAARFFPRFGFRTISREEAPPAVHASEEFRGACPASATVMRLDLEPRSPRAGAG